MSKIRQVFSLSLFTIFSWVINYLTYPILLKHLSASDFALFSVFSSIVMILSIPSMAYGYTLLIKFRNQKELTTAMMKKTQKKSLRYTFLFLTLLIFLLPCLLWILDIRSWILYTFLLFSVALSFLLSPYSALLQARELFFYGWLISSLWALARLIITSGTLYVPSLSVALWSIVLPGVIIFFLYWYITKSQIEKSEAHISHISEESDFGKLSVFFLVTIVIVLLQNVDILLVKYLFPLSDVAIYASVSVITKFAIFIIAIVETVYSPALLDTKIMDQRRWYVFQLFLWNILAYFCAFFLLPYFGEILLSFMKAWLVVPYDLFRSLWFAAVSIGFLSLYMKILTAWKVSIFPLYFLLCFGWVVVFFTQNLTEFAFVFASFVSVSCIFVSICIWKKAEKSWKKKHIS